MHLREMKSAQVDGRWYHVSWKCVINTYRLSLLHDLDTEFSVCSSVEEVAGGII